MNLSFQKICILLGIDLAIYDLVLLFVGKPVHMMNFIYYLLVLDILLVFILIPFLRSLTHRHRKPVFKNHEDMQLLYQAVLPDAEQITDEELYHIISLRSAVPKHDCTNAEYIQFLKKRGFLIINGKHIWLYGYPRI